jgi:hypothetical protein
MLHVSVSGLCTRMGAWINKALEISKASVVFSERDYHTKTKEFIDNNKSTRLTSNPTNTFQKTI